MRFQTDPCAAVPRSLNWGERRVDSWHCDPADGFARLLKPYGKRLPKYAGIIGTREGPCAAHCRARCAWT
jgi:hypothetical protein